MLSSLDPYRPCYSLFHHAFLSIDLAPSSLIVSSFYRSSVHNVLSLSFVIPLSVWQHEFLPLFRSSVPPPILTRTLPSSSSYPSFLSICKYTTVFCQKDSIICTVPFSYKSECGHCVVRFLIPQFFSSANPNYASDKQVKIFRRCRTSCDNFPFNR